MKNPVGQVVKVDKKIKSDNNMDTTPMSELETRAAQGDEAAQTALGLLYELGLTEREPSQPNWTKARHYWESAAQQGNSWAQFTVGEIVAKGLDGQTPNPDSARHWYGKAKAGGFSLPSTRLLGLNEEKATAANITAMKRSVMIVDDAKASRLMIRSALEGSGYTVVEAATATEAMSKLATDWGIAMIFAEANLPSAKPLEFVEALGHSRQFATVPVVIISSHSIVEQVRHAKSLGVRGWLVKPVTPQVLEGQVKKFLKA